MVLFHGTNEVSAINIIENGIDLSKGARYADFGKGFYATKDPEFAWSSGKRKLDYRPESRIAIIKFEFDYDAAIHLVRVFDEYCLEWAQFIANNRCELDYVKAIADDDHNHFHKYPICIGKTADGDIVSFTKALSQEKRKVVESDLYHFKRDGVNRDGNERTQYPIQYSFHTEQALSFISNVERVI